MTTNIVVLQSVRVFLFFKHKQETFAFEGLLICVQLFGPVYNFVVFQELTFNHIVPTFNGSTSPFLLLFSTHLENLLPFPSNLKLSFASCFSLEESKIYRLG